jgi:copper transport protein
VALAGLGLLAVLLPATWTGTGHVHARGGVLPAVADTAHLIAMSVWFGGLVLLAVSVLPASSAAGVPDAARALRRFSSVAMVCVGVLVVTGLYQAWQGLGSLAALPGSGYGRLLVFKLAVIALLLWFGAMSRSAVQRRYVLPATAHGPGGAGGVGRTGDRGRSARRTARAELERDLTTRGLLRRSVRIEVGVAVVVLGLTSVLVATPPGARATGAPVRLATAAGPAAPPTFVTELALTGGGRVSLDVAPAVVGPSRLRLAVRDAAGGMWDVPEVTGVFSLPDRGVTGLRVALDRTGPGAYVSAGLALPIAGTWLLRLSVRTSEIDVSTVQTAVTVS